jgi:hypothetical protein
LLPPEKKKLKVDGNTKVVLRYGRQSFYGLFYKEKNMSKTMVTMLVCVVGMILGASVPGWGAPMGTAFVYQGSLKDGDSPANGSYDFKFHLYDVSVGGIPLGAETENGVVLLDGYFDVELDFGSSPFHGEARWLSIEVKPTGGLTYTTLSPRQELKPTPYSLYAAGMDWGNLDNIPPGFADGVDNVGGGDADWFISGNNMYSIPSGNVGIGITAPEEKLHVIGASKFNVGAGSVYVSTPGGWPGIIGYSANGHRRDIIFDDIGMRLLTSTTSSPSAAANGITIAEDGNVGIGTNWPGEKLAISGNIHAAGTIKSGSSITLDGTINRISSTGHLDVNVGSGRALRLESNATSANLIGGYSGNSVAGGVVGAVIGGGGESGGEHQAGSNYTTIGGGWHNSVAGVGSTIGGGQGNDITWGNATISGGSSNEATDYGATVGGGLGNTASGYAATVAGGQENTTSGSWGTIGGGRYNTASGSYATVGGGGDPTSEMFSNSASGDYSTVGGGQSNSAGANGATISGGYANSAGGNYSTVCGGSTNNAGGAFATISGGLANAASGNYSFAAGRRAKANHQGAFVWADGTDADFPSYYNNEFAIRASGGMRVASNSTYYGGIIDNQSGGGDGLRAFANVSKGNNWGAIYAINDGTSPAIYAYGTTAGYFSGNVTVTGTVSKGGGSFKIDHPLDPTNKYLCHSFVESPDMMNIYNGNVILDDQGEAWVVLPEWFEALNKDFRYQLTAIGAPGPNLYIAEKVSDNRFKIAGGEPGMEVSWQVTGIRQDPFAEANRIPVEIVKPDDERGTYLHPDAYGAPQEKGVNYTLHQAKKEVK